MYTHGIRDRKGCVISILRPTFDQEKIKFCKQQKIGGFKYFGDSDVVNIEQVIFLLCTVEKFKFSESLLDDKNATNLSS